MRVPTRPARRDRISAAALLVKVKARTDSAGVPSGPRREATRCVRTRVLPLPAPARTRQAPSPKVTAASCSGFSPETASSLELRTQREVIERRAAAVQVGLPRHVELEDQESQHRAHAPAERHLDVLE